MRINLATWMLLVSEAGTFQPTSIFAHKRPNTNRLVLRDVPGEDRTMDSYNAAINRAFEAAAQQKENAPSHEQEDSSMSQYMLAMKQQQGNGQGNSNQGTTMNNEVDSAMTAYKEAMNSVQQGEPRVESAKEYMPSVDDLSSQHDKLQQEQQQQAPQNSNMMQPSQTSSEQQQHFEQQQQLAAQQQQQRQQAQQVDGLMQPDPEQEYKDPQHAQSEYSFQQKQPSFQPDPEPAQRNPVQQQQQQQQHPAAPKAEEMSVEQRLWGNQDGQGYYKKPQRGSIFDKDYKYKNSVPRIGDMYEMGPPPEGHVDPAEEAAVLLAAQKAREAEAKAHAQAQAAQAAQTQAAQVPPPQAAQAPPPQPEKSVEERLWGAKSPQQQYHKKPQKGSIFDKDYKYKNSVPRIGDMYEMGPPPEGAEEAYPVGTPPPQASAPQGEVKVPEVAREQPAPQVEAPPPPLHKKASIASFPNFGNFADEDDDYDAYGNLKRKPVPGATSKSITRQPEARGQQGPAPPDMVIPAVSQLPDWAQTTSPEVGSSPSPRAAPAAKFAPAPTDMIIPAQSQLPDWAQESPSAVMGSSQPTASLEAMSRSSPAVAPPPQDLMIPAVEIQGYGGVPDWAMDPNPPMGSSRPTESLNAEAARSAPQAMPATNFAPAPTDMLIPAVSQLPDWAQNPFPAMGNSQPTVFSGVPAPSPVPATPQDLMIPAVPAGGASSDATIGCSIDSYSDLPAWVLESKANEVKSSEVIDESFVQFGVKAERTAAATTQGDTTQDIAGMSSAPPATTAQENATPRSEAVAQVPEKKAQENATPRSDAVAQVPEKKAQENATPRSDAVAQVPEAKAKEAHEEATAKEKLEVAATAEAKQKELKTEVSKKSKYKSWKSSDGKPSGRYAKTAKMETKKKKKLSKKDSPREPSLEKASKEQEDAFAAYMDVMAPIVKDGANLAKGNEDPIDIFTEMMAPKQDSPLSIPSFGADSVTSVEEIPLRKQDKSSPSYDVPSLKAPDGPTKGDAPESDQSASKPPPRREAAAEVSTKKDVSESAKALGKGDVAAMKKESPQKGDASAAKPSKIDTASKLEFKDARKKDSSSRRSVGGAPASAFPKSTVSKFSGVGRPRRPKGKSVLAPGVEEALQSPVLDEALMAEIDQAMAIYEEAMAIAEEGADLRETVQHVLDAENGPLSGWSSLSSQKERLFGGKDDAIRAHNHMREMQREQARKESIEAYQRVSQDGAPFFMNLNEPTMLMMDLQQKGLGATMPSLMVSTDSDVVESILQDKPDLSKNLLDSTSGSLLVVNDAKPRDDIPLLQNSGGEEELDGSYDETEQILRRSKISEGYTAWDAFQKLEVEWDALEAPKFHGYDTKWLRKVQNGVPPPYQFVTEDAAWSQPHCWDKLRAQKNRKLDYDVIVAGGSVGIFFAMALQLQGMVVCVLEGADLVVEDKDWKGSMEEMQELKTLGIITQDDLEAAVEIPLKSSSTEAEKDEVFVSLSILVERVAERFKSGGGTILEHSPMMGIAISEYTGAAVNLGEGREPITANLVLDCNGEKSPIARQRRYGRVPDGVCAVVGSCAAGFKSEDPSAKGGSMVEASEKTELGKGRKKQYFWESVPKDKKGLFEELEEPEDADAKTTYMFTYVDGDKERPSFKSLMDDYWGRLAASQHSTQKATELDVQRVMFAYFPTYGNSDDEPQWSRILNLGDLHDSLSIAGLSPAIPHLGRISNAIVEALENECLHKDDLAEISAYIPSLSATWMLQKSMGGDKVEQEVVNQLVAANSDDETGPGSLSPYFQDAVSFDSMLSQSSEDNPSLLPETVQQAGLPKVLDWMKHGSMMSVYKEFDKRVTPQLEEKVDQLEPRQKFRWRRRLEAWKAGAGKKKDRQ